MEGTLFRNLCRFARTAVRCFALRRCNGNGLSSGSDRHCRTRKRGGEPTRKENKVRGPCFRKILTIPQNVEGERARETERERESSSILAQAASGSSPWVALREPPLSNFVLAPPPPPPLRRSNVVNTAAGPGPRGNVKAPLVTIWTARMFPRPSSWTPSRSSLASGPVQGSLPPEMKSASHVPQ